mmetsp:Transcript_40215/g.119887  ORF Transcript_40215/g.119887 Transcript_40215/m.119887 type:complete len:212 (-) Transcript_40215:673-1308(-)
MSHAHKHPPLAPHSHTYLRRATRIPCCSSRCHRSSRPPHCACPRLVLTRAAHMCGSTWRVFSGPDAAAAPPRHTRTPRPAAPPRPRSSRTEAACRLRARRRATPRQRRGPSRSKGRRRRRCRAAGTQRRTARATTGRSRRRRRARRTRRRFRATTTWRARRRTRPRPTRPTAQTRTSAGSWAGTTTPQTCRGRCAAAATPRRASPARTPRR